MSISTRAQIVTRRTYNRPLNEEGTEFETWGQTVERVVGHQRWLWERAKGGALSAAEESELDELATLMNERKVSMSGRTLWLGGTEVAKRREASQFNCSFTYAKTVNDIVDILWLLLQGCGVGFKPVAGTLSGFAKPINAVQIIRSSRTAKGGNEKNVETWDPVDKHWTIRVGDSAEAWAKAVGKLMAGKYPAEILTIDCSEIRPAGGRLAGYGWISSGDEALCRALAGISEIMSKRAGQLLKSMDILDIVNWLGTVLSSRRSAEIALYDFGDSEWEEFAVAKNEYWVSNPQRAQSNNSLVFWDKPERAQLRGVFQTMLDAGGSEPGFINGKAATARAPWFAGVNPCAEILLGDKSFCNLTEIDLAKFRGDSHSLHRAAKVLARANYRQTCVDFRDGILQDAWHQNNEFLRLCGVGITGVVRSGMDAYDLKSLRNIVIQAAYSMADELGTPRPKNVTTIKPSGTLSKIMDTTEGVHKPLGKYILNNVNFSKHDPVLPKLRAAGYKVFDNPIDPDASLVCFPVEYKDVTFDVVDGKHVNLESAVSQLNRYKLMMDNYVEQNCSVTISYDVSEVEDIVDWLVSNWDSYVGVSFILRADPTKTAEDLGYLYLPQEVTTREKYEEYVARLSEIDLGGANSFDEILDNECAGGACPIR